MPVDSIYLVSAKITPVPTRDVDRLEKAIGNLPHGYREFMARCGGAGELCDEIRVYPPKAILAEVDSARTWLTSDRYPQRLDSCLEPEDWRNVWLVGSSVDGDRFIYFPQHPGMLFNIWRSADKISEHPQAYRNVSRLTKGGTQRHPFPYFDPEGKHRAGHSFDYKPLSYSFPTRLSTNQLAKLAAAYWKRDQPTCLRMPKKGYGDAVYLFVQRLGGLFTFTRDEQNFPGEACIGAKYDKGNVEEVKAFEREFRPLAVV